MKSFRQKHGNDKVGEITVDMMYGGMRGMKGLVTETSVLDADEVRFYFSNICDEVLNLCCVPGYSVPRLHHPRLPRVAA